MKFHPLSQSMNRATSTMDPTTQPTFFQGGDNPKKRTSRNDVQVSSATLDDGSQPSIPHPSSLFTSFNHMPQRCGDTKRKQTSKPTICHSRQSNCTCIYLKNTNTHATRHVQPIYPDKDQYELAPDQRWSWDAHA